MPFYEYQCATCRAHLEALQKITDGPLRKCPSCGKNTLRKLVSAPVFRLKGGGWYETDFKKDKEGQRNIAGDKEPAPAEPAKPAVADAKSKDEKSTAKPAADATPAKPVATPKAPAAAQPKTPPVKRRTIRRRPARRPGR
jgi:putative FmdB family regulatory protein